MGCCGSKREANSEYEVTFRDGSTKRVATMQEARIVRAQDMSVDPTGRRKVPMVRSVPKIK